MTPIESNVMCKCAPVVRTREMDMEPNIHIARRTLSDGSHVFDVFLGVGGSLAATTEADAQRLASKIADAIAEHTTHLKPDITVNY